MLIILGNVAKIGLNDKLENRGFRYRVYDSGGEAWYKLRKHSRTNSNILNFISPCYFSTCLITATMFFRNIIT